MDKIPDKSPLISRELEEQLKEILEKLEEEVQLVCVWKEGQKESEEMAGLVNHICSLSEKLSWRQAGEGELGDKTDISLCPLTALYQNNAYTGIAFHGVTGGREMNALVMALYNTGGPGQRLEPKMTEKLRGLESRRNVKVMVSLSCHHCAKQVVICQQAASKAPGISAEMIDARLYPQLVEKYKIERIPMTIIDEEKVVLGVKTIEEMYELLK